MGIKYQNFLSNNLFFLILLFAVIVVVFLSYNRFIVRQDYIVGYEGKCDSLSENCFVGCENDECTTEYYYTKMQKYAVDLYAECGKDITECETANVCLPKDKKCSVTYCNPEVDGDVCSKLPKETNTPNNNPLNTDEKNLLPDDNTNNPNI